MRSVSPRGRIGIGIGLVLLALLPLRGSFGQPELGPELEISRRGDNDHGRPMAGFAADGSFTVLWSSYPGWDLEGQRFDSAGRRRGGEFTLEDWAGATSMAMDARGDFVVAWGAAYQVVAQRFASDGSPRGTMIDVASSWAGRYYFYDLAAAATGDFVVSWVDYFSSQIRARRYDADDNPVGDSLVAAVAPPHETPAVAIDAHLNSIVVWAESPSDVWGRRFDGVGAPLGGAFRVSTDTRAPKAEADVAAAPGGSFIAVWRSDGQDGDDGGIFGQRFASGGERVGSEFLVNTQRASDQFEPAVAMGPGGDFVVVWTSNGQDGSGDGVFGQVFDADGQRVGGELQLNVRSEGAQSHSAVAVARNGEIVAVWEGPSGYGDLHGIFGRRFVLPAFDAGDADGDGVGDELDNCPTFPNADQADAQGDGFGDACVSPDVVIPAGARIGANPTIGSGTIIEPGVAIGSDAFIGEHVRLSRGFVAGDRLSVGDLVFLGRRSHVGSDVTVDAGTRNEADVGVGDRVSIGEQVVLRRNVTIENRVTIQSLVVVLPGARIGEGATVETGAQIGRGAIVLPGAVVPAGTTVPPGAMFPPDG